MPAAQKYDSGGKAQWVLERLTERPHSRQELKLLGVECYGDKGGRKIGHTASALLCDDFICERRGKYEITRFGMAGLATLQQGRDLYPRGEPTVRVFVQRAA